MRKPPEQHATNDAALELIRSCESFVPRWYLCPAQVWTIGYGTTENLMPGLNRRALPGPITEQEAEQLLRRSLAHLFEPAVVRQIRAPLSENEFSALVSFTYNVGEAQLARSRLRRLLNEGDYDAAAEEFGRWIYGGGRVLRGLVRRREAEKALFLDKTDRWEPFRDWFEPLEPHAVQPMDTGGRRLDPAGPDIAALQRIRQELAERLAVA